MGGRPSRRDTQQADELHEPLAQLVVTAQREGTLRPDVGSGDVRVLFNLVFTTREAVPERTRDAAAARALGVILDGLRASGNPLPGEPLTGQDVQGA